MKPCRKKEAIRLSEKDDYIKDMRARGHSEKAALNYWDQKSGDKRVILDPQDEAVGGVLGGQIARAYDEEYTGFGVGQTGVHEDNRSGVSTENVWVDRDRGLAIKVFKKTGIPVVRKMGDRTTYEVR